MTIVEIRDSTNTTTNTPCIQIVQGRDGMPDLSGPASPPGKDCINGKHGVKKTKENKDHKDVKKGGVVFTRWGRLACPNTTGTQLLYKGSYSCKDDDKEGQNTQCNCIELEEKGKFNCTNCLLVTVMKDNTWTALIKGQRDSSIS